MIQFANNIFIIWIMYVVSSSEYYETMLPSSKKNYKKLIFSTWNAFSFNQIRINMHLLREIPLNFADNFSECDTFENVHGTYAKKSGIFAPRWCSMEIQHSIKPKSHFSLHKMQNRRNAYRQIRTQRQIRGHRCYHRSTLWTMSFLEKNSSHTQLFNVSTKILRRA